MMPPLPVLQRYHRHFTWAADSVQRKSLLICSMFSGNRLVIYYQLLPEPANGDAVSVLSSLVKSQSISGSHMSVFEHHEYFAQ